MDGTYSAAHDPPVADQPASVDTETRVDTAASAPPPADPTLHELKLYCRTRFRYWSEDPGLMIQYSSMAHERYNLKRKQGVEPSKALDDAVKWMNEGIRIDFAVD